MKIYLKILSTCILLFANLTGGTTQSIYFFLDSNQAGYYDTGLAFPTAPSELEQSGPGGEGDKIPVESNSPVFQGKNSLKLQWTSNPGGDWSALVIAPGFPSFDITYADTLSFWAYSAEGISATQMPAISMEGAPGNTRSNQYRLNTSIPDLPAGVWTLMKVPLATFFEDVNQTNIDFTQIKAIIFNQDQTDGRQHTMFIDMVRVYKGSSQIVKPPIPTNLMAQGYDSHTELRWSPLVGADDLLEYQIYRSTDEGGSFELVGNARDTIYVDFLKDAAASQEFEYKLTAFSNNGLVSDFSETASASIAEMTDEELLNMVQEYTFRYFWDFAHPVSGLALERNTSGDVVTIGGSGFGVMAILSGIEKGFISREAGRERINKITDFLGNQADRFHGAWPHWMNGSTGEVIPFSELDDGADLVETAFMIQGLLAARQFFDGEGAEEEVRVKITGLWEAVGWDWFRQSPAQDVLFWHWSPNHGFAINFELRGFNETMITYLLAIASPTHPVPASLYETGWAGMPFYTNGQEFYGYPLEVGFDYGGPLFFAHYSFLGFDPRNKKDMFTNYFEQNKNHTLIHRAYSIDNPKGFVGYDANTWGLTASDDPFGYLAHEPASDRDNGTITPTAALSSIVYTPEFSIQALKNFYRNYGDRLWGPMGFYDAFNPTENWFADSYLAIDQGPIMVMIENYRSGLLWNNFMKNPEIQPMLDAIGFETDDIATGINDGNLDQIPVTFFPNPILQGEGVLSFHIAEPQKLQIILFNINGEKSATLLEEILVQKGFFSIDMPKGVVTSGIYILEVKSEKGLMRKNW